MSRACAAELWPAVALWRLPISPIRVMSLESGRICRPDPICSSLAASLADMASALRLWLVVK